jgi:hypothetical protein
MKIKSFIRSISSKTQVRIAKACASLFPSIVLFFFLSTPASARDVTLGWDAVQGVLGYKVYYKPGTSGGRKLGNYRGKGALEGDSPITMPLSLDENPDPYEVEFTLHGLPDNKKYVFVVTAYDNTGLESSGSREIQALGPGDIPYPYNADYNSGWRVTAGNLEGFTVFYHDSNVIIPTLGSSGDIPALRQTVAGVNGVGVPLNLQPSGTNFSPPVTLLIPCPGYSDVSSLDIYYYDESRGQWFLAHDADDPNVVQPDAVGWLVPGSRVNNNTGNPPTIEIQVYHFSGVQAGTLASASASSGGVVEGGSAGGGCFISALRGGN